MELCRGVGISYKGIKESECAEVSATMLQRGNDAVVG